MSEFIHKKHNVSVLLYHIVCPAKYRRAVFTPDVDEKLKEICAQISLRYEIEFLEIGADSDHVHFLVACSSNLQSDKDCANNQINHRQGNLSADAGSEKAVMGRRVLVGRIFYQQRWDARH